MKPAKIALMGCKSQPLMNRVKTPSWAVNPSWADMASLSSLVRNPNKPPKVNYLKRIKSLERYERDRQARQVLSLEIPFGPLLSDAGAK